MSPRVIIALLALAAVVVALSLWWRREATLQRVTMEAAARALVERLQGTFTRKDNGFRISASCQGRPVTVDLALHTLLRDELDDGPMTVPRVVVQVSGAGGSPFELRRRAADVRNQARAWLATDVVQTGDKAFDERFMLKGRSPDETRAALPEAIRGRLMKLEAGYPQHLFRVYRDDATVALEDLVSRHDVAVPRERLVEEIADLWFHSMLLLARDGVDPLEPLRVLRARRG